MRKRKAFSLVQLDQGEKIEFRWRWELGYRSDFAREAPLEHEADSLVSLSQTSLNRNPKDETQNHKIILPFHDAHQAARE
ncbi:MAG: hypothetical protein EHM18_14060 [Acidobacteria bacterium]|nr:MAG: hypothetical protein EHM18_14060 [Acidobacteriota bacterium]